MALMTLCTAQSLLDDLKRTQLLSASQLETVQREQSRLHLARR